MSNWLFWELKHSVFGDHHGNKIFELWDYYDKDEPHHIQQWQQTGVEFYDKSKKVLLIHINGYDCYDYDIRQHKEIVELMDDGYELIALGMTEPESFACMEKSIPWLKKYGIKKIIDCSLKNKESDLFRKEGIDVLDDVVLLVSEIGYLTPVKNWIRFYNDGFWEYAYHNQYGYKRQHKISFLHGLDHYGRKNFFDKLWDINSKFNFESNWLAPIEYFEGSEDKQKYYKEIYPTIKDGGGDGRAMNLVKYYNSIIETFTMVYLNGENKYITEKWVKTVLTMKPALFIGPDNIMKWLHDEGFSWGIEALYKNWREYDSIKIHGQTENRDNIDIKIEKVLEGYSELISGENPEDDLWEMYGNNYHIYKHNLDNLFQNFIPRQIKKLQEFIDK